MAGFQEEFFSDIRDDIEKYGMNSLICQYFRNEQINNLPGGIKKNLYERLRVINPEFSIELPADEMAEIEKSSRLVNPDKAGKSGRAGEGGKPGKKRRLSSEHIGVKTLCKLNDYLLLKNDATAYEVFLDELACNLKKSKVKKEMTSTVSELIERAKDESGQRKKSEALVNAVREAIKVFAYADSLQFMYDAGYPLSSGDRTEQDSNEDEKRSKRARIKTVPLKLLDFYFANREISIEKLNKSAYSSPSRALKDETMNEKIQDVYNFVCNNEMEDAVIPLMYDNDSGSGLYILGKNYLQSWDESSPDREKVEKILKDKPCCYAIVKFMNLEFKDGDTYYWSPSSVVDRLYQKSDIDPNGILFDNLNKALNIYKGQLQVSQDDVLYGNYRDINVVDIAEKDAIDSDYKKYFEFSDNKELSDDEDLNECVAECKEEYSALKQK